MIDRCIAGLAAAWFVILTAVRVLWACRAPALSVAVGLLLIWKTDQARDIVIAGGGTTTFDGWIFMAVSFWAVVAWYWARTTLEYDFARPQPDRDPGPQWRQRWREICLDHGPRVIGTLAIVAVALAFREASKTYDDAGDDDNARQLRHNMWLFAGYAVIFYSVVWLRKPAVHFIIDRPRATPGPRLTQALALNPEPVQTIRGLITNPIARAFFWLSLLATPLFYVLFAYDPVGTSAHFRGAVPAVLFGLALIVPITSLMVIMGARARFPLFELALIWLVLAPGWLGDIHDVRTCRSLAGSTDPARHCPVEVKRPMLKQAFLAWWKENTEPAMTKPIGQSKVVASPLIVVATAGGASRAAFWTTQVLGEIAQREERFADRLFMISGVSGGSLGAAVFRSIVEVDRRASPDGKGSAVVSSAAAKGRAFVMNDFLGPALAAGLYVDLPSSSGVPLLLPDWLQPGDRAAAIEKSWEEAWKNSRLGEGSKPLAWTDGFNSAFGGDRPWPLLVLNGTSVEKGKRIIMSNASFWTGGPAGRANMSGGINRYDAIDIMQSDVPVSTAVTMSARFPVISPTGALRDRDGKVWTRVIDGGLFENFGAFTADEVLRYLVERVSEVQTGPNQVVPIAILISSDPSIDQLLLRTDGGKNPAPPDCDRTKDNSRPTPVRHPGNGWDECPVDARDDSRALADPLLALYDGRTARGEAAATALSDRISDLRLEVRNRLIDKTKAGLDINEVRFRLGLDDHNDFFHFRQCRVDHLKGPTMSWHDSKAGRDVMRRMLGLDKDDKGVIDDWCGNQAEFFRLCVRLARLSGESRDDQEATDVCALRWPKPKDWVCDADAHSDAPAKWRRPFCHVKKGR